MTTPIDSVLAFRAHTAEAADKITSGYAEAIDRGNLTADQATIALYELNRARLSLGDNLDDLAERIEEHGCRLAPGWRDARSLEDLTVPDWSADPRLAAAQARRAAGPPIEAHADTDGRPARTRPPIGGGAPSGTTTRTTSAQRAADQDRAQRAGTVTPIRDPNRGPERP